MRTIIDTAAEAGNFTTLIGALQAASLIDTLRTTGPFTLFAPTDAAFRLLANGVLDALLKDRERLYAFLTHHVASGVIASADMASGEIRTIGGAPLVAVRAGGEVFVNGVSISRADIPASNGIMHVIDEVILPFGTVLAAA